MIDYLKPRNGPMWGKSEGGNFAHCTYQERHTEVRTVNAT